MGDKPETNAAGLLKMKELVEATGVPKSTILHYLHQGLLPQPVKTSPNMARYRPETVERIGFIKRMQARNRLPLAGIKKLLAARDRGLNPEALVALQETLFGDQQSTMTRAQLLRRSGLDPGRLDRCLKLGLIMPLQQDRFDQEDLAMARMYASQADLGLSPADGAFYIRLAEKMVDEEMKLRRKITAKLPLAEDAAVTMRMTQAARAMRAYIIDRVFLHRVMAMADLKEE